MNFFHWFNIGLVVLMWVAGILSMTPPERKRKPGIITSIFCGIFIASIILSALI